MKVEKSLRFSIKDPFCLLPNAFLCSYLIYEIRQAMQCRGAGVLHERNLCHRSRSADGNRPSIGVMPVRLRMKHSELRTKVQEANLPIRLCTRKRPASVRVAQPPTEYCRTVAFRAWRGISCRQFLARDLLISVRKLSVCGSDRVQECLRAA